jgi:hypothetical protein
MRLVLKVAGYSSAALYGKKKETDISPGVQKKSGPKPAISDTELLGSIRGVLESNLFHSEGYKKTHARLRRKGVRVREIYDKYIGANYEYIAVMGDLNEVPNEAPMDPLIRNGSTLTDIIVHPKFKGDGRPGTIGNGTQSGKFDYILMSPALSSKVTDGGIERRGVWGGKNGTLFPHLPDTMKKKEDAASDHAALWVDLNI